MVDLHVGRLSQDGLGVKGNPEARCRDHLHVICAVADGERFMVVKSEPPLDLFQSLGFGVTAENRLARSPGQTPFSTMSSLARCSSKPSTAATWLVNGAKPPETSTVKAPCAFIVCTSVRPPG